MIKFAVGYSSRLITTSFFCLFLFISCQKDNDPVFEDRTDILFTLLPSSRTGINFSNDLDYSEELNPYTYRNFYNGAGVGLGDLNNDGLVDIYFCGNLIDNKLYLNKGNFEFEDITASAGVACADIWSTGVVLADVNADGWLDIYVCKSGPPGGERRHNELFINNGDLTFTEKAEEYGLAEVGLSTHAAFFDYDRDGDLDCYILNNSIRSTAGYDLVKDLRERRDPEGGNKLFRNDLGRFVDVSEAAGIYGSPIGFGLGVTVGDVNQDGWPDFFVSNDFFERDYLYINQKNGSFAESLTDKLPEISMGSMGADMADLTNDGLPEIFVTEMLPKEEKRLKTKADFQNWNRYQLYQDKGYHRQFSRNVLQLNRGNGLFSEISRLAGVEATDWSWGALIFDMDNDGWKDIFVANGIYKDLLDRDYINFYSDPAEVRKVLSQKGKGVTALIDEIPSEALINGVFRNTSDLVFEEVASEWGLDQKSFSNGSAYADLDNDGDLDLVVNNSNMEAFVFRNNSKEQEYLRVKLKAENTRNTFAIGARVKAFAGDRIFYQELNPMRGFQSCTDYRLHFGLGAVKILDSLVVHWPNGAISSIPSVTSQQEIVLEQGAANQFDTSLIVANTSRSLLIPTEEQIAWQHEENAFIDFDRDPLLFQSVSTEGPAMAVGDINGDGRPDIFLGGAKDQTGQLWIQDRNGQMQALATDVFQADSLSEDTDALFFDADGDEDLDLYVCSGGYEFGANSTGLLDRLYINQGRRGFVKSKALLPSPSRLVSSSCVRAADFDADGDLDLFVGGRLRPFLYGVTTDSYLLENDGEGNFSPVKRQNAPFLKELGMVTDAQWLDIDTDGRPELAVAGEWMGIRLFKNQDGVWQEISNEHGLADTEGWWHSLLAADVDEDGDIDLIGGNQGLNNRFEASKEKPIRLYVNDFDQNGQAEQIMVTYNGDNSYPLARKDDIVKQMPGLQKKYLRYEAFAGQTMEDIFDQEVLDRAQVQQIVTLASTIFYNDGEGQFNAEPLPAQAQFSPIYAIYCDDLDGDQQNELILGGNLLRAKPELGVYGASFGLVLDQDEGGFFPLSPMESGVMVTGEIRAIAPIQEEDRPKKLIIARNNDRPIILERN